MTDQLIRGGKWEAIWPRSLLVAAPAPSCWSSESEDAERDGLRAFEIPVAIQWLQVQR